MTHIRCWNDHRVIRAVAARRSAPWHKLLHRQDCGRKRAHLAAVITLRHHTLGIPHGMRLKLGAQDVIAPSSSSARNVRSCTALLRHRLRFLRCLGVALAKEPWLKLITVGNCQRNTIKCVATHFFHPLVARRALKYRVVGVDLW